MTEIPGEKAAEKNKITNSPEGQEIKKETKSALKDLQAMVAKTLGSLHLPFSLKSKNKVSTTPGATAGVGAQTGGVESGTVTGKNMDTANTVPNIPFRVPLSISIKGDRQEAQIIPNVPTNTPSSTPGGSTGIGVQSGGVINGSSFGPTTPTNTVPGGVSPGNPGGF